MPCEVCKSPQASSGLCSVCKKHYAEQENISGTSIVQFFERDVFVGDLQQYSCGYADGAGRRHSCHWPHIAFFCPSCGELWGRAILTHRFFYNPTIPNAWQVVERSCVECGDGQFLSEKEDLGSVSSALLFREFQVLLMRYES